MRTRRRPRRDAPALAVVFELEQPGRFFLVCDSFEDEQRLRGWLRRSRMLEALPAFVERLLDDLDERDREAA